MEQIALSLQWKNRLDKVNENGIKNKNFKSKDIDLTRNYNFKSFQKILSDKKFLQRETTWLSNRIKENKNLNCRFLLKFPEGLDHLNDLRSIFLKMQIDSGIDDPFIFCSSDENEEIILNYINNLNPKKRYTLVLSMSMDGDVLSNLIQKSLDEEKFNILFLYEDWKKNIDNFNYVIRLAEKIPEQLHIAFVPVDVNKYGDGYVLSTILIAKGFKSLSLIDTPFKAFFSRWIGNKKKTIQDRINESRWVGYNSISYEESHPINCNCLGINPNIKGLAEILNIKPLVTFHILEVLSKKYKRIKENLEEKEKVLQTQEAKIILTALNLD